MLIVLVVKGIPEDEKMVEEYREISADNIVHIAKLNYSEYKLYFGNNGQ